MPDRPSRLLQTALEERSIFSEAASRLSQLRAEHTSAHERVHTLSVERARVEALLADAETGAALRTQHVQRSVEAGRLRATLDAVVSAHAAAERKADELETALHAAEHHVADLEVRVARTGEAVPIARAAVADVAAKARVVAAVRIEAESDGAAALVAAVTKRREEAKTAATAAAEYAVTTLAATRAARAEWSGTATRQSELSASLVAQGQEFSDARVESRLDAILSLKSNIELVHDHINANNSRAEGARLRRDDARAAEYAQLLAQGLNPFEVWRARERDARAAAAHEKHEEEVELSQLALVGRVLAANEKDVRAELQKTISEEDADDVRRKKHRGIREARTAAYIMARTTTGDDTMDPLGRGLYPSATTFVKPPAWGTGRAAAANRLDILALEAQRPGMEGVAPVESFLPRQRSSSADEAALATLLEPSAQDTVPKARPLARTHVVGQGPSGDKQFALRPLSVYEQRLMAAARARQRAAVTITQVAAGKTFSGAGFISTPPVLHFKDFTVGEPFEIAASLTNASFSFNSFRFESLPPEYRDLFIVRHTPPGRMSAGLSCPYTVTFTPRVNEDIFTDLPILAQTGLVQIPIRATKKRAVPVVREIALDCGIVTLGESTTRSFVVENLGALPLRIGVGRLPPPPSSEQKEGEEHKADTDAKNFTGEDDEGSPPLAIEALALAEAVVDLAADAFTFPELLVLDGYSSVRLPCTFAPAVAGVVALPLRLSFDDAFVEPIDVLVRGTGQVVPMYVETDLIDFRVCLVDKLYRCNVVVRNRSNVTVVASPRVPLALVEAGVLVIVPTSAYVLPRDEATGEPGRFVFEVRFRPSLALLEDPASLGAVALPEAAQNDDGTDFDSLRLAPAVSIPIDITAPTQVLPVPLALTARVSLSRLDFSPESLDFGSTPVGQAVSLPLTMSNCCALPQKYGFTPPRGFKVASAEGDGFGVLLPGASVTLTILFAPQAAGEFSSALTCTTLTNCSFSIPVRGTAFVAPIGLSHSSILMAATAVGECETASVLVTNLHPRGGAALDFYVSSPEADPQLSDGLPGANNSQLTVRPSAGSIQPGESARIAIKFSPTTTFFDAAWASQRDAVSQRIASALSSDGVDENLPRSVHHTWRFPVFWRRAVAHNVLDPEMKSNSKDDESQAPLAQTGCLVQVSTTALPAFLTVSPSALTFGNVPVGHSKDATIFVTNSSVVELALLVEPLPIASGITLVTPPPLLAPGETAALKLVFTPTLHRIYVTNFTFGAVGHSPRMSVALTGKGIAPQVSILPAGAGAVDFRAVIVGDRSTRTFSLCNATSFPMPFRLVSTGIFPTAALSSPTAAPPFFLSPSEGIVPPNSGTVLLTATFAPSHATVCARPFLATFVVDVDHQDAADVQRITLCGRAFDRSLFVAPTSISSLGPEALWSRSVIATRSRKHALALEDVGADDSPLVASHAVGSAAHEARRDAFLLLFEPSPPPPHVSIEGDQKNVAPLPSVLKRELHITCVDRGIADYKVGGSTGVVGAPPGPGTPATFKVTLPHTLASASGVPRPHFFKVSPESGTITPGQTTSVVFSFSPPPPTATVAKPSEWHVVEAMITLSGGAVVKGAAAEAVTVITLRAHIEGSL